jgi:hypothetical protein
MSIEARFMISGSSGILFDIDVLDPSMTGLSKFEIAKVRYSPYFPLAPYLESGVAENWEHAIYGSGSFFIEKTDGKTLVISPIFFADKNIFKTHFNGFEHWNTEFWRYIQGETPRTVKRIVPKGSKDDIHQINKTEWLEIIASGTGFSFKNRIQW